jgi:predicted thioesterase
LEAATVVAAGDRVDASSTTVGVEVALRHRRASAVGARIEVEVTEVTEVDRGLAFAVVARELPADGTAEADGDGADPTAPPLGVEVASGRVVRAVVDRAAFLARLTGSAPG